MMGRRSIDMCQFESGGLGCHLELRLLGSRSAAGFTSTNPFNILYEPCCFRAHHIHPSVDNFNIVHRC